MIPHGAQTQPLSGTLESENRSRLEALRNQIDFGQGGFVFLPVEYDLPGTLEWIWRELTAALGTLQDEITLRRVDLPLPSTSSGNILDVLRHEVGTNTPGVLFVTNLDKWFPDAVAGKTTEAARAQLARALQPLNLGRNVLRDEFPCPLLLCLPAPAMSVFLGNAPDLNTWKSGYYAFHANHDALRHEMEEAAAQEPAEPVGAAARLEALLRDAEAMGVEPDLRARLQERLGQARLKTEDRSGAVSAFEAMMSLAGQAGDDALRQRAAQHQSEARHIIRTRPAPPANALGLLQFFPGADSLSEEGHIFGRASELTQLIERLTRTETRFQILWGATGSGKSSLARAGLVPQLSDLGFLTVLVSDWNGPEGNCIAALDSAVERFVARPHRDDARQPSGAMSASPLENSKRGEQSTETSLRRSLREATVQTGTRAAVFICDQFEQFFDRHPRPSERLSFLRCIAACLDDYSLACKFVFVLREDRLGRMTEFEFSNGVAQPLDRLNRFELPLFSAADAKTVLQEQAQRAGLNWDNELIAMLVTDLSEEEWVLPIDLQIAATALALSGAQPSNDYARHGRADGLIFDYIPITLDLLKRPVSGDTAITIEQMQRVMLTLISENDPPRRLCRTIEDISNLTRLSEERTEEIVARLKRGRLVRLKAEQVELTHDRLIDLVLIAARALQDSRRRADRVLHRALEDAKTNPRHVLRLSDARFVRKHADPQHMEETKARWLLARSLRTGWLRLSVWGVGVIVIVTAGLFGVQSTYGYLDIVRDARERVVVRRGLPWLQFLPGPLDNSVLLDTGYTWNDLDHTQGLKLQQKVVWDFWIGRRHSDVIFASWFVRTLKSPAEQARLLLAQGNLKAGWEPLDTALHSPDAQEQAHAVQVLGQLACEQDGQATEVLHRLDETLKPSSPTEVRKAAVLTLSKLLQSGSIPLQSGFPLLTRALNDSDEVVHGTAATTLRTILTMHSDLAQKVTGEVGAALDRDRVALSSGATGSNLQLPDPYGQTAAQACLSLVRNTLDSFRSRANSQPQRLSERLTADFPTVFYAYPSSHLTLTSALGEVARTRPAAAVHLFPVPLKDTDAKVSSRAIDALQQVAADTPGAMHALVSLLKDQDAFVRRTAAEAVGQRTAANSKFVTSETVSSLVLLLKDTDRDVRSRAAYALGQMAVTNSRFVTSEMVSSLVSILTDIDSDVRSAAVDALGQAAANSKKVTPEVVSSLVSLSKRTDPLVRSAAVHALGLVAKADPHRVVSSLISALSDVNPDVRNWAADALGQAAKVDPQRATIALLSLLKDTDPNVRSTAIRALGWAAANSHELTPEVVSSLVLLLKDTDSSMRVAAAFALGRAARADPRRMVSLLVSLLKDPNAFIRRAAADALGQAAATSSISVTVEIVSSLLPLLSDEDTVRSAVVRALGQATATNSKSVDAEVVSALMPLLRDTDPDVRSSAADALGKALANSRHVTLDMVSPLAFLLEDLHSQSSAADALGQAARVDPQRVATALLPLLKHANPNVRSRAAYALGQAVAANSKTVTSDLVSSLVSSLKLTDSVTPSAVAYALGQAARTNPQIVGSSLLPLLDDVASSVRMAAAAALKQVAEQSSKGVTPKIVSSLMVLIKDPDPTVRTAAASALGQAAKTSPEEIAVLCAPLAKLISDPDQVASFLALCLVLQTDFHSAGGQAALRQALTYSDPAVRVGALYIQDDVLHAAGRPLWDRAEPFLRALKDRDHNVRSAALSLLLTAAQSRPDQAIRLLPDLTSKDDDMRYSAAAIVQAAASQRPGLFLPDLLRLLQPVQDFRVQATALALVDHLLTTSSDRMQTELLSLMRNPREEDTTRAEAAYLLNKLAKDRLVQNTQSDTAAKLTQPLLDAYLQGGPLVKEATSAAFIQIAHTRPNEVIQTLLPSLRSSAPGQTRFNIQQAVLEAAKQDPRYATQVVPLLLQAFAQTAQEEMIGTPAPDPAIAQRLLQQLPITASPDELMAYPEGQRALPGYKPDAVHTDAVYRSSIAAAVGQRLNDPRVSAVSRQKLGALLRRLRDDKDAMSHLRLAAWDALGE